MKRYIALLRGINVGGKRKILMADLKKLLGNLGFTDSTTYIQSGNVAFNADELGEYGLLGSKIEQAILKEYGFEVPVIISTADELKEAIANNPFLKNKAPDIERLHLTFLNALPTKEKLETIRSYDYSPDQFEIIGKHVFVYCSGKYSDSKLSNAFFEQKLNVAASTRNWKTVLVLSTL